MSAAAMDICQQLPTQNQMNSRKEQFLVIGAMKQHSLISPGQELYRESGGHGK